MNYLWKLDIDTVLEWYEFLKKLQEKLDKELSREETELVFFEFMKSKNIKSCGATELTKDELIKELISKNDTILNIDKDGCKIIKKKEEK